MRFLPRSLHTSFLLLASCLWLPTSPPVRAVVDTNANGLSDVWEQRFNNWELFGSSFNPQTDNDGDGWTNAQEAAAGTHPFDGNPPGGVLRPGIVHLPAVFGDPDENGNPVVITPDALQVAWPTLKGKRYTLQFSTDLTLGGWSEVESPVLGNGGTLTYTFVQQSTALFWRVIVADHDSDGDEFTDWEEDQKGTDPQVADRDDDGLPDSWEIENGLNPNDNSGGNGWDGDFDNDGVSNGNELQGDGEPDDPADFPVQVIQIMKGAGGYSNMIPYEPPSKPYSGRQYSGAWWTGAGYVEVPVTDAAMTPAYLAPILDGIVFPAIPPAPPGVVQQSNLALSNIYCRSSVSRPSANSGVGTGLTSRRVWIKAPAAPVTRKFTFVKTKDLSTHVYETSTNPYAFVSAEVVTATIPANETISNPIDLKHIPTLVEGSEVIAYERLKPIELIDIKDHSKTDDDVTIADWNPTQNIQNKNIAWIEAHSSESEVAPRMPQLVLRIPGLPQNEVTLEAKLEIQYNRGNGARAARNQPEDRVRIPANGDFAQVNGSVWNIYNEADWQTELAQHGFFGGEASLTYRLLKEQTEIIAPQTMRFRIGGKNPDRVRARHFIESLTNAGPQGSLWFACAIAQTESKDYNGGGTRYNQFWQLPNGANDIAYRTARQAHAGRPVWGDDGGTTPGGYGMFQVTGNASDSTANIPRQKIWNWQDNARGGLAILGSKRTTADAWMTRQKNADNANGVALPSLTVGNVTFAEGTNRTMSNAVTMKAWNGASAAPSGFTDPDGTAPGFIIDPHSGEHLCYWKNSASGANKWALSRYNNPPANIQPFNYVNRVCQEVE